MSIDIASMSIDTLRVIVLEIRELQIVDLFDLWIDSPSHLHHLREICITLVFEVQRVLLCRLVWMNSRSHFHHRNRITLVLQENFDKRDNLWREKVSKRDNFPCYLT
jgi:hypothetical protein